MSQSGLERLKSKVGWIDRRLIRELISKKSPKTRGKNVIWLLKSLFIKIRTFLPRGEINRRIIIGWMGVER